MGLIRDLGSPVFWEREALITWVGMSPVIVFLFLLSTRTEGVYVSGESQWKIFVLDKCRGLLAREGCWKRGYDVSRFVFDIGFLDDSGRGGELIVMEGVITDLDYRDICSPGDF